MTQREQCTSLAQVFFYLPVGDALQQMWDDPTFCEALGGGQEHGFWSGTECTRIDEETDGQLKQPNAFVFHLGLDWVQPFAGCSYSTGFMFIK